MTPVWLHRSMGKPFLAVEGFASRRIWGDVRKFDGDTIMAVLDNGELAGCVVYHNYSPENETIEVSAAAQTKRWLTRPVLLEMFSYPFEQIGCQSVVARVSCDDAPLCRIFSAYGFKGFKIPRLRGRDEDEMIFVLHDDVWRTNGFHKEHENGKKERPSAHAAA